MSVRITDSKGAEYLYPDVCGRPGLFVQLELTSDEELLPGDIIPYGSYWDIVQSNDRVNKRFHVVSANDDDVGNPFCITWRGGGTAKIWHGVMRPVAAKCSHSPASTNDLWNGRCHRCGKGTYTGFASVEHDGVCL